MGNTVKLLGAIALCQAAGAIGSFFTMSAIPTWYAQLEKPIFTPPNWLFGPVWLILYTIMGISLYRVWQKGKHIQKTENTTIVSSLYLFYVHLVINAYWSIVFFGMKDLLSALLIIIILAGLILVLIVKFFQIDRIAGLLLIPYYFWAVYAVCLNFTIWQLNRI
ncbi:MAG: tryptophan-rich sensory protein [Candidatus Roizmanbacteria bacterium]|nr:tryptophan-rich sensory protein [Candidatus Roizmanbacteria bacterium]